MLTPKDTRIVLARQNGEATAHMLRTLRIRKREYDEWLEANAGQPVELSEEDETRLCHWASGDYATVNDGDTGETKLVLRKRGGEVLPPPVRPAPYKLTKAYEIGVGRIGMKVHPPKNRAKDMENPRAAEHKAKAQSQTIAAKVKAAVQPLWPNNTRPDTRIQG